MAHPSAASSIVEASSRIYGRLRRCDGLLPEWTVLLCRPSRCVADAIERIHLSEHFVSPLFLLRLQSTFASPRVIFCSSSAVDFPRLIRRGKARCFVRASRIDLSHRPEFNKKLNKSTSTVVQQIIIMKSTLHHVNLVFFSTSTNKLRTRYIQQQGNFCLCKCGEV